MLADVCDLVVASEDAKFVNPSLRHAGTGAEVLTLPWTIDVHETKELLWAGDPLYAADAKDLGLVNRVVPTDELYEEASRRQAEEGFGAWLEFRDSPFRSLAEEYGKEDPHVS